MLTTDKTWGLQNCLRRRNVLHVGRQCVAVRDNNTLLQGNANAIIQSRSVQTFQNVFHTYCWFTSNGIHNNINYFIIIRISSNYLYVGLVGLGVTCSPRDTRFTVSNPAEVDGFFQDVKILSTSPPGGTLSWGSRI